MPMRRTVRSLQRLCLENVARNMQHIKDDVGNNLDGCHVPCTEGPFSELVGFLVHELLQLMGDCKYLTCAVLRLLLVPQLTELNLSICPWLVSKNIAQIIRVRCKNLSLLNLKGCVQIPAEDLADLVKGLPGLRKLYLSKTQCNTQVLSAVGSCCQRLLELDVSGCERLSPDSLLHLAYDRSVPSLCCPVLQRLNVHGLEPSPHSHDLVWALAFVLLALPNLKVVVNDSLAEAVCLIHHQQLRNALFPQGFPSLEELWQCRVSTHTNEERSRFMLPLREIYLKSETFLPVVNAVCPHLSTVTVIIEDGSSLGQTFFSWCHLNHLTIFGRGSRDLRELLPVMMTLGAQLQSLSFSGFCFEDELSFHALLNLCLNLQKLSVSLLPPVSHNMEAEVEALGWDFSLTPLEFPQLRDFFLMPSDLDDPLPSQHATVLRASLISLLKYSPCLQNLELFCLPFSLDEMFEEVLESPGQALVQLRELFLLQDEVSVHTIHRLLSSDNQLCYLTLEGCPDIYEPDYDELLRRVHREGIELQIVWW